MTKRNKRSTLKRILRWSLLVLCVLIAIPTFVLVKRIVNDYPLREYVKDKFIDQLKGDLSMFTSSSKTDEANLSVLKITISDKEYSNLEKQIDQRLNDLQNPETQVMGTSDWQYVNAKFTVNDKLYTTKLKIRGDMPSNYNRGIEEATLRMNLKKTTFRGKKKLSLIKPEMESGYFGYLYYKTFQNENFLANHIEMVQVYINDEYVGLRFLQEGFSKELLESNERREGMIVRFKDDCTDCQGRYNEHLFPEMVAHQEKKSLKSESLSKNYSRALSKYNSLKNGELAVEKCFNIDQFARFFALTDIFLGHHSYKCQNIKMYFNPIDDRFEPIAWDPNNFERYEVNLPIEKGHTERFGQLCNNRNQYPLHYLLAQNPDFLSKYTEYLNKYAHDEVIEKMIKKYADLINKTEIELFRQNFQERFNSDKFYSNLIKIQEDFAQKELIYAAYYRQDSVLKIQTACNLPVKIDSVEYGGIMLKVDAILKPNASSDINLDIETIPFSKKKIKVYSHIPYSGKKSKYSAKVFESQDEVGANFYQEKFNRSLFVLDYDKKTIKLLNKITEFKFNQYIPDLGLTWIIEPGTRIILTNSFIVTECTIKANGTKESPISISSNHTGGILVKNTSEKSNIVHTKFINLSSPYEGNWNTTGAVTFYRADVRIKNCLFLDNMSEDALNIVNSKFNIIDSKIEGAASDALDIDFGRGQISNITVINPKNDALDFSGSKIYISSAHLEGAGDKALSAGERTKLTCKNVIIKNSFIGVAAKDSSRIRMSDSEINDCQYNFTVYQKKQEYDKAKVYISNSKITGTKYLLETGCKLTIDKESKKINSKDVYGFLYGTE